MPDPLPTSTPAGQSPPPPAPVDPVVSQPPAPVAEQPGAPSATSAPTPASGTAPGSAPAQPTADDAFAALMAEAANPPDNQSTTQPTPAPAAAQPPTEQQPQKPEPAKVPTATEGEQPEADVESLAPSPEQQQAGTVPVKNLTRALKSRREAIDKAKSLEQELTQERVLTDRVLDAFTAAGVQPENLPAFISHLAKARSDEQSRAALLAHLGIQLPAASAPPVQPPAATPAPVSVTPDRKIPDMQALRERLDAYDIDGAQAIMAALANPPAPAAAAPPVQPQPTQPTPPVQPVQPVQPTPPQQRVDPLVPVRQAVNQMGRVLKATFGEQEAKRLADAIDAEAKQRFAELAALEVEVTPKAAIAVYEKANGEVLARERQRLTSPPTQVQPPPVRPTQSNPPPAVKTADEQFNDLVNGRT